MDELQRQIIELLRTDARPSIEHVAKRVGADMEAVAKAIDEAESAGLIRGYRAVLGEAAQPDDEVTCVVEVKLVPERDRGFERIAARVARFSEVQSCWLMSGSYDLLVTIGGPSVQAVARFVAEKLAPLDGVTSTATHFRLRSYKEEGILLTSEAEIRRLPVSP